MKSKIYVQLLTSWAHLAHRKKVHKSAVNPSSWLLPDPRCEPGEMGSSEVQRLGQVVRDMDGQFGSGVFYRAGETEVSASCRPSRAGWETYTQAQRLHQSPAGLSHDHHVQFSASISASISRAVASSTSEHLNVNINIRVLDKNYKCRSSKIISSCSPNPPKMPPAFLKYYRCY